VAKKLKKKKATSRKLQAASGLTLELGYTRMNL